MIGGPLDVPPSWRSDVGAYRDSVLRAATAVRSLPATGDAVYVEKAEHELEHLLALWPHVLCVPTRAALGVRDLIVARAWPVHPLGVVDEPVWADGRWCSPAEMFFHDVDHARFKVREDLLARGVVIPDPYVDGSTFDAATRRHRTVLDLAAPHVDDDGWVRGPARERRVIGWLDAIDDGGPRPVADAARWLLFELLHEKGLPIEVRVLVPAIDSGVHVSKLRSKCERGFFAEHGPSGEAVAALDAAARRLRSLMVGDR